MSSEAGTATIVFDGVCVLCNGWVRFVLRHDHAKHFRFAAMQARAGRDLLLQHGLDPDSPASLLLIDHEGAWTDTQAIARIFIGLGGRWRWLAAALHIVPRALRDRLYRLVARNRYQWFGMREQCIIPSPEDAERFLD